MMVPESDRLLGVVDPARTAMAGLCRVSTASSMIGSLVAIDFAELTVAWMVKGLRGTTSPKEDTKLNSLWARSRFVHNVAKYKTGDST